MRLKGFDWDLGNLNKVKKHGLEIELIEEFLNSNPYILTDEKHNFLESRFIAFGEINGRYLFVAFTIRVVDLALKLRVISARFAHKKEVEKFYEKNKNQEN